jgi:hypothetical protein
MFLTPNPYAALPLIMFGVDLLSMGLDNSFSLSDCSFDRPISVKMEEHSSANNRGGCEKTLRAGPMQSLHGRPSQIGYFTVRRNEWLHGSLDAIK